MSLTSKTKLKIGGHYACLFKAKDIVDAIEHTRKAGGNMIQVFNGKNTATTIGQKGKFEKKDLIAIRKYIRKIGFQIYIHASLTLNFCNPMVGRYRWMMQNLIHDIEWGDAIGATAITVHLGSVFPERYDKNIKNPIETGYQTYVKNLREVVKRTKNSKVKILIETSAGQERKIGNTVEELGYLYDMFSAKERQRIGICLDTCHIFSVGYDIGTKAGLDAYLEKFRKLIGVKNLGLIHLNDSEKPLGSHTDFHANLMHGHIFKNNQAGLKRIVEFAYRNGKPMALETRSLEMYAKEIKLVKRLIAK